MLHIYAIIGSILILSGIVYIYIFVRYLLANNKTSEVILAISEALATLVIGAFYIYFVVLLANYSKDATTNFTNTIDDILVRNETFEYIFTTSKPEEVTENEKNNAEVDFIEAIEENTNQFSKEVFTVSTEESIQYLEETSTNVVFLSQKSTPSTKINKTEEFIKNYQNFLKEIIKQRLSNSSIFNQTFSNMKYGPPKIKTSRDIKIEPEEDSCFYDYFIENALLMYSFIHCLLTLIKNTLQCRTCIKSKDLKSTNDQPSDKKDEVSSDVLDTSDSEKNDNSAPVGPIFVESVNNPNVSTGPNLKIFQVKGTQPKLTIDVSKVTKNSPKFKIFLQLIFMWFLPILSLIILYFSTKSELKVFDYEPNILAKTNFTIIPVDQNMMEQLQIPVNVSSEVDTIVNKIYNIVNEAKETNDKKTTHFTPMIAKIIYTKLPKPIQKISTVCTQLSIFVKVYYLLIFIIGYFVVILFAKMTQTTAKERDLVKAKQQNICLLTFSLLWLPSILDLFTRTFITQEGNTTILSDIFLALGNSNRIQTMFADHIFIKKHNKPNLINPA